MEIANMKLSKQLRIAVKHTQDFRSKGIVPIEGRAFSLDIDMRTFGNFYMDAGSCQVCMAGAAFLGEYGFKAMLDLHMVSSSDGRHLWIARKDRIPEWMMRIDLLRLCEVREALAGTGVPEEALTRLNNKWKAVWQCQNPDPGPEYALPIESYLEMATDLEAIGQ